jgi:hypothetical protein
VIWKNREALAASGDVDKRSCNLKGFSRSRMAWGLIGYVEMAERSDWGSRWVEEKRGEEGGKKEIKVIVNDIVHIRKVKSSRTIDHQLNLQIM